MSCLSHRLSLIKSDRCRPLPSYYGWRGGPIVGTLAEDVYGSPWNFSGEMGEVTLNVRDGHLVAKPANHPTGLHLSQRTINRGAQVTALMEPVAFFLPEHAMDPSVRSAGEELWIEVTVPKTGPPRPIQLAIKRGDSCTPLGLK
jgi:hypothetical protein